jgi:hypothetical protein
MASRSNSLVTAGTSDSGIGRKVSSVPTLRHSAWGDAASAGLIVQERSQHTIAVTRNSFHCVATPKGEDWARLTLIRSVKCLRRVVLIVSLRFSD